MTRASVEYHERNKPLGVLACAQYGGIGAQLERRVNKDGSPKEPPKVTVKGGKDEPSVRFEGSPACLRWCARAGAKSDDLCRMGNPIEATQIDQWIDWSVLIQPGQQLVNILKQVNSFIASRSYLVGESLSLADLAVWGSLASMPFWETKLKKDASLSHLARWYEACSNIPEVALVLERDGNKVLSKEAKAKKDEGGSFEVKLEGAVKGKVVTRFPPEPSGYLHIGHTKAALLNQYFAQKYEGKMILRFDDTNPSKEKDEFVENIIEDLKSLEIRPDVVTYTSDSFPQLFDVAEKLIKKGHVYADDTPVEKMREERMEGIESKCRNRTVKENLAVWEEMKKGSEEGLKNCMRIKLDMQNGNKALRDPVIYRCNLTPHHRTGSTYKLYPTYDFACPFVDSFEGVTHALRTIEYKDREAQYQWILKLQKEVQPSLPDVHIWEFSRLNFVNTVMSKRKLQWFVDTGKVDSWSDPRFPTVQGLLRRGLQVKALKDYILLQGASKNTTVQEWDKLWTMNKKLNDPVCARHTAVVKEGKVALKLTNGPAEPEVVILPRHKKFPGAGKKATTKTSVIYIDGADAKELSEGEEVTLMDWGNCIVDVIKKDASGQIEELEGRLHPEGSVKTTKLKLTWLPQIPDLVDLKLEYYDHIITKKKLEDGDNIESLVNPNSKREELVLGDANTRSLNKGEVLQLERKGYFIVDQPYISSKKPVILIYIPDGRSK